MSILSSFNSYVIKMIQNIDYLAFKVQSEVVPINNNSDLSNLNALILHPNLLYQYMESELKNSLFFNLIFLIITFYYIPFEFWNCYETDKLLTIWLICLSIINNLVVIPKFMALYKLKTFKQLYDRVNLSRALWLLIRCKVYKFITKISKICFFIYLIGIFRVWQLMDQNRQKPIDQTFISICEVILICFFSRIMLSFIKFNYVFNNDSLEKEEGLNQNEKKQLKIEEFNQISLKEYNGQDVCPICCEIFKENDKIRIMSCPGKHIFHIDCIDKWLISKKTCPNCNHNLSKNIRL